MAGGTVAAYGVRLRGLGDGPAGPDDWPVWEVEQRRSDAQVGPGMTVRDDSAWIGLPGFGEIDVDRAAQRVRFSLHEHWPAEALLHPGFSPAGAVIAHWMGRTALHASALVVDGLAWGLLGDQGTGKSTTAAHLVDRGCPLLTDDLLVIDGETAYAGPPVIDLRGDVGAALGGVDLGVLGARERWRRRTVPGPRSAPLGGFVELRWSEAAAPPRALDAAERLAVLGEHAQLPVPGDHLLALADRPLLRWARTRGPTAADGAADTLVTAIRKAAHR